MTDMRKRRLLSTQQDYKPLLLSSAPTKLCMMFVASRQTISLICCAFWLGQAGQARRHVCQALLLSVWQSVADLEPHVAQIGLMPPNMGMRQWLSQRPAVFELDGQSVALTRQSIEYDRHLETQFVAFLQRLGRPAHLGKDIGSYCKEA